ncbi:MAG: VCBS repeat-containing protein [Flavobacteriales bacterium]|nr:hypothetical protein [Flavobacteriales bacterium]MCC6577874.1 VCBS repeat-containing protein [Flavobacteriales bacterium]
MHRSLLPPAAALLLLGAPAHGQFVLHHDGTIPVTRNGDPVPMAWAGGLNWCQVSQADLDLDGTKDIFIFDRAGGEVVVLRHDGVPGSTNYTYDPVLSSTWPFNELDSWALLRDYNCDGKEDLFAYAKGQGGFGVYRNVSDGGTLAFELAFSLVGSNYVPTWSPNLYVTQVDVPAIDDIDADGDLDVITFSIFGSYVEYHKNLSMEQYGTCDSLTYEVRNRCWGYFSENINNNSTQLNHPCGFNVPNPEFPLEPGAIADAVRAMRQPGQGAVRTHGDLVADGRAAAHVGSTLLTLDLNGDTVRELILGDISFNTLNALFNGGSLNNAMMVAQDSLYPASDVPVELPVFPGAYHVDVNQDGKRDLVVSPNATSLSHNDRSVWYYLNTGTDAVPVFILQDSTLWQGAMLDFGEGAYPVPFDHNGDGLMDLVVANYGYYNAGGDYPGKLALLENTGTATAPAFTLVTTDYMGLSGSGIGAAMYPAFGDLDGDGDQDLLIGDLQGRIHRFQNTSTGAVAAFSLQTPNITDNNGVQIDVGQFATPQLVRVDGDTLPDLLVGERNGNINYYRNTGTATTPVWTLENDSLGGVVVNEWWNVTGYSVPWMFVNNDGERELLVGSESGWVHHYKNIDNNLGGLFTEVDSMFQEIREGMRSSISLADINGDGHLDAFTGNYRGGLGFWRNDAGVGIGGRDGGLAASLVLRPNPSGDRVELLVGDAFTPGLTYRVVDAAGAQVLAGRVEQPRQGIDIGRLAPGAYAVQVDGGGRRLRGRLMVVR